ncbi:ADP-ribosylhydrolase ARH3 isoform X4 [Pseudorca crassidens]|uniref:ADP-ribosylhydrolase ARH3 isoform X4 n=1 Tax=Pseudorca crassidens TaxID=82174 RepID=UPI00352E8374
MAAAAVMTAAGCGGAGAARSLSRFRGCLAGALLGDCVGAVYEARDTVDLTSVLRRVQDLEPDPGSPGSAQTEALCYTDDTAMARALVQSLLAKEAFDEMDMAHRFAQEYKKDPDRGYGAGVITVFRKLLSPKCRDVFEPARAQFNGKGSYGNGGAMRVAGISLAYSSVQDVQKVGHGGASVLQPTEEDWGASRAGLSDQRGGGVRARWVVPHPSSFRGMALLPLNLCPPPSTASCAAWSPTPRSPLPSTASRGLSSIPSHLVGTQTPLPPWPGPLLAPTMAWNRCQRAGSKAVRAMRRLTSWPRACTGSSRRICEGHSSAIPSRTNYSSDWKPWAPLGLAPCLGLPAVWPECTLGAGDSSGEVTEQ